ncbi:MAG: hypothetical protein M5U34_10115 [Chloroflexi bacterium]|nr:hypothetical protein [Chloroflexota bacterium]
MAWPDGSPGAPTLTQFWENLAAGVEAISQFTDEELLAAGVTSEMLQNSGFVRAGGVIEQEDMFAAEFLAYTPREAEITAPSIACF